MKKVVSVFSNTLSTIFLLAVVTTGVIAVADVAGWRVDAAERFVNNQFPATVTLS